MKARVGGGGYFRNFWVGMCRYNDSDGYENVKKALSRFFHLVQFIICRRFFFFFFWSWILKHCIIVQEKKKEVIVLCSRPPENVELGIFTW